MSSRFTAAVISLGFLAATVYAHDIGFTATRDAGQVRIEAFFDDDAPVRDARVIVQDANKNLVIEGRTDAAGKWSFTAPPPGAYVIIVDAGDGHRAEERLTVAEGELVISDVATGTLRSEFTRPRWLGLFAGLALIATVVLLVRLRRRVTDP